MPSLKQRERRLLLIASIVIGCWAVVSLIVVPLREQATDLEQRLDSQTLTLETLHRLLAQRSSIEQRYQAASGLLSEESAEGIEAALLAELEALAQRSGVQINLKPKPTKQEGQVSRVGVELDFHATQEHLLGFLDELLRANRLIQIERLHISGAPGKPGLLRAQLHIEQLTLQ